MRRKRQENRNQLTFLTQGQGEAIALGAEGSERLMPSNKVERPALGKHLMEEACMRGNMMRALDQVKRNSGAPGVDGMTVEALPKFLKTHWPSMKQRLLEGTYRPSPVRRAEIEKREGGGVRQLGIPTVLDRLVQQALLQVLQPRVDSTFSKHSYGFRPGRSAHQAIARAQQYIAQGCDWVVDLDLEKFFDRVNHDRLMGKLMKRIEDKRVIKLIRAFLNAGVMEDGLVHATSEGTPQGGPLSPFLSNIVLDELDQELERRGHRFVRYADDCNVYVKSEQAGLRVMKSITSFIQKRLKLKVNAKKSAVAQPSQRKFLGFSFTADSEPKRKIAWNSIQRFKVRIRELTSRVRGKSIRSLMPELRQYLTGWLGYFGYSQIKTTLENLEGWTRRRLRMYLWVQWKTSRNRFKKLHKLGLRRAAALEIAGSSKGPWRLSKTRPLHRSLSNAYFTSLGLPEFQCFQEA
jgi:RNA-directed DNA polymerase